MVGPIAKKKGQSEWDPLFQEKWLDTSGRVKSMYKISAPQSKKNVIADHPETCSINNI